MEKNETKIWFPAAKYGLGWGLPVAWQGWIVFLLYFVLGLIGIIAIPLYPAYLSLTISYILIISILFIYICWKKGEKTNFRWGKK